MLLSMFIFLFIKRESYLLIIQFFLFFEKRKQIATAEGRNILNTKFKLCTNLTKPEDVDTFFGMLLHSFFFTHSVDKDRNVLKILIFLDYLEDVYANLAMVGIIFEFSIYFY